MDWVGITALVVAICNGIAIIITAYRGESQRTVVAKNANRGIAEVHAIVNGKTSALEAKVADLEARLTQVKPT